MRFDVKVPPQLGKQHVMEDHMKRNIFLKLKNILKVPNRIRGVTYTQMVPFY